MPQENRSRVEILISVARFIFDEARILIGVGLGETETGTDLNIPGEIENIPTGTETYRWADACIKLIRYIALQLGPAITDYYERDDADAFRAFVELTNTANNDENESS